MSYDLFFYKKKDSPLTAEQVIDYLNKNFPYNTSDNDTQWEYQNPDTEVAFLFNYERNMETEYEEDMDRFSDYTFLEFTTNINFLRPHYYGYEVFPVIEKIINDLDLYVLNYQDEEDPENPRKFPEGYLMEQWITQNDSIAVENFVEFELNYMPAEISNYIWQYNLQKEKLQNKIGDDIFVAGYLLIKSDEDGQVHTVCVWPDCIPIIHPPVDFFLINKKVKKGRKTVEESGLVPYSTILEVCGEFFEDFEHEIPGLRTISIENAAKAEYKFNELPIYKTTDEFGEGVDAIVNAKP